MFIKIDKSTFINTDQVTYFHEETGILKLTTGETFRVDQKYTDRLQKCFGWLNAKQLP